MDDPVVLEASPSPDTLASFLSEGFAVFPQLISREFADDLNMRLEDVLCGRYDNDNGNRAPDKHPKVAGGRLASVSKRTLQIVNIWKADRVFASLVRSRRLGQLVALLGGWTGARVANDQVWAKPPGAGPLSFHRDSSYFTNVFAPSDVITVWLALDDMEPELGPLEYVHGSHRWGEGRHGSAQQFFAKDRLSLVHDAARREGLAVEDLTMSTMAGIKIGGCSIHSGRTWHGSGPNTSPDRPRRGLGIHFIQDTAQFISADESDLNLGPLWAPGKQPGSVELLDSFFPLAWSTVLPLEGGKVERRAEQQQQQQQQEDEDEDQEAAGKNPLPLESQGAMASKKGKSE